MVEYTGTDSRAQKQKVQVGQQLASVEIGITAQADTTKANATQLTARINRVDTVAGAADSVLLPKGEAGLSVLIINDGASAMQVFGKDTDTIDGIATGTGVALTNANRAWFHCTEVTTSDVGVWQSEMGVKAT